VSDASVTFLTEDHELAEPGKEVKFEFQCPLAKRRCGGLLIAGKTNTPRDGQNKNGGKAQWGWDGNRESPTFTPSINCTACWHGFIEKGRCVNVEKKDEPELT
jgi:hypothetical protein